MKHLLTKVLCIGAFHLVFIYNALAQQQKYALVIGAQNYVSLPALRNSLNDAKAITAALQNKGFQVKTLYDPKTKRELKDAINWYYTQMQDKVGAVGLIYYAGHGLQYHGDNYIIPTTASLQNPGDLEDYCLKMNIVMEILNASSKSLNILLLDACRSLPSFTRGSDQGLSKMSPPEGSIIVFATTAGKVASDGDGSNGLFTSKLLGALNEPGLNVNEVFRKVQREVYTESGKQQLPELDDLAIGGDFFFTPNASTATPQPKTQSTVIKETANNASVLVYPSVDFGYGFSKTSTVKIGDQEWITQNLNVDHFANGDIIPEAKTADEWKRADENKQPAWCYYNNNPTNGRTYGKIYNWYAVNDTRGLAPKGWHVPSDEEWAAMANNLGGDANAGSAMKSTTGWSTYSNSNSNSSGFTGLSGGSRTVLGEFGNFGSYGEWWSSSLDKIRGAKHCLVYFASSKVTRNNSDYGYGMYVRCLKGDTASQPNESTLKSEPSYVTPKTAFDYGYGTADARTVTVGKQEWLGKNLNVDHFANGDLIPEAKTDGEWKSAGENKQPAWCYYKNDPANGHIYGKLYNWYAVIDPRGLAPKGWHIPNSSEWKDLMDYLGGYGPAGLKMKNSSGWSYNGNGNNNSGFGGLPGGERGGDGTFYELGERGFWWGSEYDTLNAYYNSLMSRNDFVNGSYDFKSIGHSVRCLRD